MARTFPKDRFDDVPSGIQRVGAHRAPHRKGRGWIGFAWAALATLVLVGLGALAILSINGSLENGLLPFAGPSRTPSSSPTPSVTPTLDASLTVVVLNGTPTQGLAADASELLASQGWKVAEPANASQQDIEKTVVYYSDPANEGAALGVAESLEGRVKDVGIQRTDNFVETGVALTVVVGGDYAAAS